MKKALKALKRITAKHNAMDETEYIMSSPEMVDILRKGDEEIENGKGKVVTLDEIWK
jgi:antitoxin YefM